jgi:hypothetical protein
MALQGSSGMMDLRYGVGRNASSLAHGRAQPMAHALCAAGVAAMASAGRASKAMTKPAHRSSERASVLSNSGGAENVRRSRSGCAPSGDTCQTVAL